jgi:hypothetical protein
MPVTSIVVALLVCATSSQDPASAPQRPIDAVVDVSALPKKAPVAALDVDAEIGPIHAASDSRSIYAHADWLRSFATIDVESAHIEKRIPIDERESSLHDWNPAYGDRLFFFDGAEGSLIERDLQTGSEIRRIATPFRGGDQDSPLYMSGWHMHVTCDGSWVLAAAKDGSLHSFSLETGKHKVELPAREDGELWPLQTASVFGTSQVLIDAEDDEHPLRIWDQAKRAVAEVPKVPMGGWRAGWGRYALNVSYRGSELWDLSSREQVQLRLPEGRTIETLVCNLSGTAAFIAFKEGGVLVMGLRERKPRALLDSPARVLNLRLSVSSDERWLFVSDDLTEYHRDEPAKTKPSTRIAIYDVAELTR